MRVNGHLAWLLLAACTPTPDPKDPDDSDVVADTEVGDTELPEETDHSDLPETDVETDTDAAPDVPLEGFGGITGACGLLDPASLADPTPRVIRNAIDFGSEVFAADLLTEDAETVAVTPNRGGSSINSEAMSMEVLYRCELAILLKTERDILYDDSGGKKTDLLIEIDGLRLGNSVTRAFRWPGDVPYPVDDAEEDLLDKLGDALLASANVSEADAWARQILHILAWNDQHADALEEAYERVPSEVRGDTIVWVTVTHGLDGFVYGVDDPPP
jgi:hypothetical protein